MQSFNNITRSHFMAIRAAAEKQSGLDLGVLDNGQAAFDGFSINWAYVENNGLLMVNIDERPWWCSESAVEGSIAKFVDSVPDVEEPAE